MQLSQKSSLTADGQASTPASVSSVDHSSQLASSDAPAPLEPKMEVKQQPVTAEEEEEAETEGKPSGKMGMLHSVEVKSEEKPEVRATTKLSVLFTFY